MATFARFAWTLELLEADFLHSEHPHFVADLFVCRNFKNSGVNALFYWHPDKKRFYAAQDEYAINRWEQENPGVSGIKLDRVINAAAEQAWLWQSARIVRQDGSVKITC